MCRVKICGITTMDDAQTAVEFGADALGFVFFQKSPRYVQPEQAKTIISQLPPFVTTVGVFVNEDRKALLDVLHASGIDVIQFHGSESPSDCDMGVRFIKAVQVRDTSDISRLSQYPNASAFLLDTYSADAYGGTGETFNWDIAVAAKNLGRIILAGGLTNENIEEAVRTVQPYGVDVSSGVESSVKGVKDHAKMKEFIQRAKSAGSSSL